MRTLLQTALTIMFFGFSSGAFAQQNVIADTARKLQAGGYEGITGGMLNVGGRTVFEVYAPDNGPDKLHDIRSATKSITALLVGKLLEEGTLKNVNQKLSDLLPGEFAHMPRHDARRNITVADVLTMRTGLACNDWVPSSLGQEDKMYRTKDWGTFLLSQPMAHERGRHFSYCTGGVVLLGRAIQKLSGMSVPDYAARKILGPLGIEGEKWDQTPEGYTDTGGHLQLKLSDLSTIGALVLQGGKYGGKQLVSGSWVQEMTSEKTDIYERREKFGYLWWRDRFTLEGKSYQLIYAHGNGGNFVFVVPELELVAAFTGTNYGRRSQFIPLKLLTGKIVPAIANGYVIEK